MKKYLTTLIISLNIITAHILFASDKAPLTVPDKIGLYLSQSDSGKLLPTVVMTVFAGSGCDQVGELQVTNNLKLNQPNIYTKDGRIDILEIHVKGFEFKKATSSANMTCPTVIKEARTRIELADVMANQRLQLKILLDNHDNEFELNYWDDVVYLNPVSATHVISWNPSENMPDKPQYLGYMSQEFTDHLAKVRVQGSYALDSDLATKLREYVKTKGYEPIDEKLRGFPRMNPLEDFIVFVPHKVEIPDNFQTIGECNYHEKIAGKKVIEVGIVKAITNPFFVQNN